jgi:hypothetical protein
VVAEATTPVILTAPVYSHSTRLQIFDSKKLNYILSTPRSDTLACTARRFAR